MKLRRRHQRILGALERDLAETEPGLYAFFESFARRTGGREMPSAEKINRWPRRMFARMRRRRPMNERMKDSCAENWNDP